HQALLLANHGAVTMGKTLDEAWIWMESLEHAARIIAAARAIGEPKPLTALSVERLEVLRAQVHREKDAEGIGQECRGDSAAVGRAPPARCVACAHQGHGR